MRFRDFKIGTKQKLAFGFILAAMATVSLFSVNRMALLVNEIEAINSVWLQRTSVISNLNLNASLLRQNQLQSASGSDENEKVVLADSMISLIDLVATNVDVYDTLYSRTEAPFPNPESERAVYSDFDQRWEEYLDLTFQIIDLESEGRSEQAVSLLNRGAGEVFSRLGESLSELVRINNDGAQDHTNDAIQTFVNSRRRIIALFLLTLVVSIAIAAGLVRHITRALQEIVSAARTVSDGDLDNKVPVRSQDEIGALSQSFNRMTTSLKRSHEKTERQAAELREQGEVLKANNADLVEALARLEETQEQLIMSEKMASLGQLTAGIAHEIKNPLNFVNNFASMSDELSTELIELLGQDDWRDKPEVSKELIELATDLRFNSGKILEHGVRADNIVKGMLQHSQGKVGTPESVEINPLVREYTNLAFHGMRANDRTFQTGIETHFGDEVAHARIIPQEFGRVLLNILNNAFYANQKRSKSSTAEYKPLVIVKTSRENGFIRISISDNGGGVPSNIENNIFEPFFTTKPSGSGTGLGLSLSYEIITKGHGGKLFLLNRPGDGAEFCIQIPVNSSS